MYFCCQSEHINWSIWRKEGGYYNFYLELVFNCSRQVNLQGMNIVMIFHRTLIWMIDISRRNSKKDSKRVTTKRKPRSLPLQMMSKLNRERCVASENEILQYSINLTYMRLDNRFQIIKCSRLSDTAYIDVPSYR